MSLRSEFFNKSKFIVTKLSDQVEYKPDTQFVLPAFIIDGISYEEPTTITASLQTVNGRTVVDINTVVTVSKVADRHYTFSATPAAAEWTGAMTLQLKVTMDTEYITIVPLVVKG